MSVGFSGTNPWLFVATEIILAFLLTRKQRHENIDSGRSDPVDSFSFWVGLIRVIYFK